MELKNKKIAFLGDSITEGIGVSSIEHVYWNIVAQQTGALCYGYGIGGTRIAPQREPSAEPRWDLYFASRVEEMDDDMDIVVVFGGTNDFGHGDAPVGAVTDQDETTFCGAFRCLLEKLMAKYPCSELIVMTPLHREGDTDCSCNEFARLRQAELRAYVDAMIDIAASYGIPVLDLFRTAGMHPGAPLQKQLYMPDGLHPNDAGHLRISQRLIGFLKML